MSTTKKNFWLTILVLAVLFALMLTLNSWMPIHRDDYEYSLLWNTSKHISSWSEVFASAGRHYFLHGGRMATVLCLDAFLFIGKIWFDLANAALFTGLVVLIYWHACRDFKFGTEPGIMALTALLAWLSFPHFGEVAIWKSGSTVYLWSAFPVFLFLLPYNLHLAEKINRPGLLAAFPMLLLGIIAGWSVENLSVTVVLLTSCLTFYAYRCKTLQVWQPAGAVGAVLGFVGLLAAPGNYVRYGEQGSGKGILIHIGNQFAGNGEMVLYLLPIILLLLLAWYTLKAALAQKQGLTPPSQVKASYGHYLLGAVIVLFVFSYFNGGFIANAIRDFIIAFVLTPLHLIKANTIEHFANVMAGFEEVVIYWMIVFFIYGLAKQSLGWNNTYLKKLKSSVAATTVLFAYPQVRYGAFLFLLALFNNFVMIAAPTFPARATFSSVVMILIGTIAILRMPLLKTNLGKGKIRQVLCAGGLAIGLFTVVAALTIMYTLNQEDKVRIAYIAQQAKSGAQVVTLPPLSLTNRALRHIFYVEFDNPVTKGGLCRYYGIKNLKVDPQVKLPENIK